MNQEEIEALRIRLNAEHEQQRARWFANDPESREIYAHAAHIMGGKHGSLHWDGRCHTNASWDSEDVKKVFGVTDDIEWLILECLLQSKGMASVCSYGGGPTTNEELDRWPLEEWGGVSIHMRGVLWLVSPMRERNGP